MVNIDLELISAENKRENFQRELSKLLKKYGAYMTLGKYTNDYAPWEEDHTGFENAQQMVILFRDNTKRIECSTLIMEEDIDRIDSVDFELEFEIEKLSEKQEDLDPEFNEIVDENFFDLI